MKILRDDANDNQRGPEGVVAVGAGWEVRKVFAGNGYDYEVRNTQHNIVRGPFFSFEIAATEMHF